MSVSYSSLKSIIKAGSFFRVVISSVFSSINFLNFSLFNFLFVLFAFEARSIGILKVYFSVSSSSSNTLFQNHSHI